MCAVLVRVSCTNSTQIGCIKAYKHTLHICIHTSTDVRKRHPETDSELRQDVESCIYLLPVDVNIQYVCAPFDFTSSRHRRAFT